MEYGSLSHRCLKWCTHGSLWVQGTNIKPMHIFRCKWHSVYLICLLPVVKPQLKWMKRFVFAWRGGFYDILWPSRLPSRSSVKFSLTWKQMLMKIKPEGPFRSYPVGFNRITRALQQMDFDQMPEELLLVDILSVWFFYFSFFLLMLASFNLTFQDIPRYSGWLQRK